MFKQEEESRNESTSPENIGKLVVVHDEQSLRERFDLLAALLIEAIPPDQLDEALNEIQRNNENSVCFLFL